MTLNDFSASPSLAGWLIGPIAHEEIDKCLQQSFPDACFFDGHTPLAKQYDLSNYKGILCLEPFQRLMPTDLWQIHLPKVALAKKPASEFNLSLGEDLWGNTLKRLNAWIPLDGAFSPTEQKLLAKYEVETTPQIWTLGAYHFKELQSPLLFQHAFITPYAWHPTTRDDHQALSSAFPDIQYFLTSQASRISFYFSKIQTIICPIDFEHPYALQILAAGAQLWIPAHNKTSIPQALIEVIYTYENLQTLSTQLQISRPKPSFQNLNPLLLTFQLEKTLPERLATLKNLSPNPLKDCIHTAAEITRLLQSTSPHVLDVLIEHLKPAEVKKLPWFDLAECVMYLRFLLGDFIQNPQEKERIYRHILGASQRITQKPIQSLCQYFVYKQRLNYHTASQAIEKLIESVQTESSENTPETLQTISYFLHLIQESVFLEFTFTPEISIENSIKAWLSFQKAYLLAYTENQTEAALTLEKTRALATPHTLGSLWCALGNYRASVSEARGWREAYPLHIWIGLKYIAALHTDENPSKTVLKQEIQHLKTLCLALNGSSQELEKVLAYERQYCPDLPLESTVLQWEGPLYSYSSLAQVNAYWFNALLKDNDYTLVHIPFEPPEQKETVIQLPPLSLTSQAPAFFISHRWPPRSQPPEAGAWISIIPWEFGAIPHIWVDRINHPHMHEVWVPSAYVAHSFWRSGVKANKITVIPNGVDTHRFSPKGSTYTLQTKKSFCFLFVGGALERKGLDILIAAYTSAFSIHDDVCLVIKTFGSDSHYALTGLSLESFANAAEIEIINEDLSPESMAELYRRCQIYVHPYRGEGFGLPILEAMACGTPVMIPDAGPAPEFCSEAAGWYIPTRITSDSALNISNQGIANVHAYFTTVDPLVLTQHMQQAYHTKDWENKSKQARKEALNYAWESLYPRLKQRLHPKKKSPEQHKQSPLPSRLYLHNPWSLLPLHNTSEIQFVNDRVLAEQALVYCLNTGDIQNVLKQSAQKHTANIAICGTEDLQSELVAGGFPIAQTCVQELLIDTQRFSPEVPAFHLEESNERFSFLLCFDWQNPGYWQDILLAYSTAFQNTDAVHLIFKPYNVDFDLFIDTFMHWFESTGMEESQLPDITFMQEDLVPEQLSAFLRGVDCFIDNFSEPLALAAIASEVAVISGSTLPCLQRPTAERYRFTLTATGESQQIHQSALRYLLQDIVAKPNPLQRRHAKQDLHTRQASSTHWQQQLLDTLVSRA